MSTIDKVIVFDIWGDYAHFRRGYTTTSPLTYPFPTRTALSGIMAAILGLSRDSYYELFGKDKSAFAIQIINPINKIRITQNLIDTKHGYTPWEIQIKGQAPRTQISFEYVKNPKYRVYVWSKECFRELKSLIEEHKSKYTLYLGTSECIANFEYIGVGNVERKIANGIEVEISTIIKNDGIIEIKPEKGKKYGKIKIPGVMNKERVVQEFIEVIYEENGKTIKIIKGEYYKIKNLNENVNVSFF